ncbi:hypothetical protein HN51_006697 [Arachis hypogaea]
MSWKLQFFKDQINKAGIMSSSHTALQPEIDLEDLEIQEALQRATFVSSSQVGIICHPMDVVESPSTYFRTNSFTSPYQEIVDAYG